MSILAARRRVEERRLFAAQQSETASEIAFVNAAVGRVERPLRIALVTSSYNYIKDGVALTLNRLVEYLERQGVEVLVIAPVARTAAFDHKGTLVPVPSIPLPRRPEYRFALGIPRATREQIRAFRPDIIHVALAPDLLGYSVLSLARKWNVPVVATYHTRYETYLKHYWYVSWIAGPMLRYLRNSYAQCREVYVPSQSMVDALLSEGHKDNFRLWPRGVDTDEFNPHLRSMDWRRRRGIGDSDVVVAHVSRLVLEKQLDTVVAAVRTLEARGVAHKLLIVGDGPERSWLARELPNAIFTGFLDGQELSCAYASSDVFLFASETESFGNVTLEAMASGLPCVCADATGSRSLVADGKTGFLAKPGDSTEFAERIAVLVEDKDLRLRMGAASRQRSLEFSWDETMARIHGYYKALLAQT